MSNDKFAPGDSVIVFCCGSGPLKGYIREVYLDRAVIWFGNGCATVSINDICHEKLTHSVKDPVVTIIEDIKEQNKWMLDERSPEEVVSD